jgi:transposase
MSYITGSERRQNLLFPCSLDEYVEEGNPVRVIAAFIDALDFQELGFVRGVAAETGRPGYDPRLLMGLYLWGHMNRVRSSRKLERECGRNLEAIWLMENLRPDFKTIADFRKNNGKAIKQTVVKFRLWCISEGLYGREQVAIDGSKFKAVNSRDRNFTRKRLDEVIKREQARVEEYLQEVEAADERDAEQQQEEEKELSGEQLREKIARLKQRLAGHKELMEKLEASGEKQISLTDPEARLMKSAYGSQVGYNVQTAVDGLHKLIAEYDVINAGNDEGQLGEMSRKAKEALSATALTVLADGGYFEANAIKECEEAGIDAYLPLPKTGAAKSKGVYEAERFAYDKEQDLFVCPQGESLSWRTMEKLHGKQYKIYRTQGCGSCPQREKCTTSRRGRKLRRWVDEEVIERLRERHRQQPGMMKERKKLVEHPFGTIKRTMDQGYFLLKGIKKVRIEMGLTVLAYNLKRAMNILGAQRMIGSLREMTI